MLQLSRAKGPAVLVKVPTVVRCVVRACAIVDVDQRGNRVRARDIKPIFRKPASLRENGFAQQREENNSNASSCKPVRIVFHLIDLFTVPCTRKLFSVYANLTHERLLIANGGLSE